MSSKQQDVGANVPESEPAQPPDKLKAERVQLRVEPQPPRAGQARERLEAPPGWQLASRGKALLRVRELSDSRLAGAYAGFLAQLAVQAGQPVVIELFGSQVAIRVRGTSRHGMTEAALEFARALG
jgi:hypothetical protein